MGSLGFNLIFWDGNGDGFGYDSGFGSSDSNGYGSR